MCFSKLYEEKNMNESQKMKKMKTIKHHFDSANLFLHKEKVQNSYYNLHESFS